ncbi:MAG: threonine synthase [Caldisericia bacterium]|nr:threonine synthase [Caldisericia bacterium]
MKKPFTIEQTWLSCINCGYKTDLLEERKFRCPKCGDLYDIEHNFYSSGEGANLLSHYTTMFDARFSPVALRRDEARCHSGVWRFKEWIMPLMPESMIVSLSEGNVPIVRAGKNLQDWVGDDIDLYIIMEGMTPTGSFKDFGGTVMMSVAKAAGVENVCCASTGDTSAMAAAYSAAAGIQCAVILPKGKITPVQLAQPLVYGAKVILLPGDFDACMKVMQELVARYGVYPANSLNPARIEGHQATVFLIAQYFGWEYPDWIAVPIGNGSNCSSVGKALRLLKRFGVKRTSKILGCQSKAANPLAKSWNSARDRDRGDVYVPIERWKANYKPIVAGETTATAARIGDPVSRDKVMREIILSEGAMQIAEERDLNEAVSICGKDGYFVCPQTGIALTGVRNARRQGWILKGSRVVVVSTATGLKFTDSAAANLQGNIISADNCATETVAKILKVS